MPMSPLQDVTIDVSSTVLACAFAVAKGGTAHITLKGTNTLKSGGDRAGLEAPPYSKNKSSILSIDGNGTLNASGGNNGAGIGGFPR